MACSSVGRLRVARASLVGVFTLALTLIGSSQRGLAGAADRIELTVDAIAAKDASGTLWLALANLDPTGPIDISTRVTGMTTRSASGETLTAPAVDSVNTFDAPKTVTPTPISAKVQGDVLSVTLEPKSVTVLAVRP
jgi:alpha-L-arabinofuranosidase